MYEEKLTLSFTEATDEQLRKALTEARKYERECEAQGSWWHTWTHRAEMIESVLKSRRRATTSAPVREDS